eukprot:CAMPEP_0172607396 /NCGR_PEP_ID=MMETSP1068-20121228/27587_1 /TAXON_ID=35684 /ORGANISM="Pseudopedinella elastica, Strain CCMP716" /LENGTH=351 /DNA_ID=CAMNT_0013410383 /DNA_START=156 /DNA_END=1208 /DNA_ORIENTATION=+
MHNGKRERGLLEGRIIACFSSCYHGGGGILGLAVQDYRNQSTSEDPTDSPAGAKDILGESDLAYRQFYFGTTALALSVLVLSPGVTWTYASMGQLLFLIFLNGLLYHHLQGSNPGYLDISIPKGETLKKCGKYLSDEDHEDEFELISSQGRDTLLSKLPGDNVVGEARSDDGLMEDTFPPLRAAYCTAKRKFVAKFDHFCPVLNTPIGERNHCLFWWWTVLQFIQFWKACGMAKTGFIWTLPSSDSNHTISGLPLFFLVIFLDFLIFMSGMLVFFHSFLLFTMSTTYELIKHEKVPYMQGLDPTDFPFSRSVPYNLRMACWTHGFGLLCRKWTSYKWELQKTRPDEATDVW